MATAKRMDASEIDQQVGERIRRRRVLLGLTQDQLGEAIGISYQQIQKYEAGANRISAGRLYQMALTLQVPVGWFFDSPGPASPDEADGGMETSSRQVIELVRGFTRLGDDRLRGIVLALVRALSERDGADADLLAGGGISPLGNGRGNGHGLHDRAS